MTLDQAITRALNQGLVGTILDGVMVAVSLFGSVVPFALIGLAAWYRGRRTEAIAFWAALLVTDALVSGLKEAIGRARPEDLRVLLPVTSEFAMPSGHAARAFAGAVALWPVGARWRHILFGFAGLTMLSRVYVGVHYVSDVIAGAFVGTLVGLIALETVRATRYEQSLPTPQRVPTLQAAWRAIARATAWIWRIDYLYTLRILGRLGREQAARLGRVSLYWGLIRLFGPLLMILAAWIFYWSVAPSLALRTAGCLGGYFLPFGIDFGVPVCIAVLKLPWWLVVASIVYIDLWLSLFLIYNFDFLYRLPWVGKWLARAHLKGTAFVRKRPWIMRIQFFGVAFFVFVPLAGTGIIPAVVLGRFIGMGKLVLWAAVMLGTLVRITALALGAQTIFNFFT